MAGLAIGPPRTDIGGYWGSSPRGITERWKIPLDVSLEGKVALVTGCGPNIGSGIALALARYGAKVAVNDVSKESIDACIARIERNGGTAMAASGDVTDEETVKGYINDVLAAWGKI